MLYYIAICILIFLGIVMCDELNDRFKRIPFGPIRIPLLGNLHQIFFYDKYLYKALTKLARAHGTTMKVWFGLVGSVVISGYERINHVLRSDEWVGEQDRIWILNRASNKKNNKPSTATENADSIRTWATARLYAVQILKETSFSSLDIVLAKKSAELAELLEYWRTENRGKLEMENFFLPFSLSLNWALITGDNLSVLENPKIEQLMTYVKQWESLTIQTSKYIDNWPMLSELAPSITGYNELLSLNEKIREFLRILIIEYRAKGNYLRSPKNLMDRFLLKIDEGNDDASGKIPKSENVPFSDDMLISVLFNLLFPSSIVLQSSLNFALLNLGRNDDIQTKLRNEIVGMTKKLNRSLTIDDMEKMSYLKAFVLELYRSANIIPFEKRKMLKTVREGDTRVTRGMMLVINYDSVNMDETLWNEPSTFKPERFVDDNGGIVNEDKNLAIIAAKRLCVGEQVAMATIMHVLCALCQRFKFLPTNTAKNAEKPEWGLINKPPGYELLLESTS